MGKKLTRILALVLVLLIVAGLLLPVVSAEEIADEAVNDVIAQLEAIDTLQEMQNKRGSFTVSKKYYDINTTDPAVIAQHEAARSGYESYVAQMFAARIAAQQAYDALTDAQKALIDPALVAKLDDELDTVLNIETCTVTPGNDEYTFEAVRCGTGFAYEVSNHMVSGQIPQTFILVDTSDGKTSWTPSGKYVYGKSNFEVAYCCDVETSLEYATDYKRVNLEDSNYYGTSAAKHIRAILQNSYPYVSLEEMKANLKAGGLKASFVDQLTRADIIAAVQTAVWTYANANDGASDGLGYFASIDIPRNDNTYFHALHDYTNECWDWLPGKGQRSFDARAEYRVNNLAYYLCKLPGVEAEEDAIVISDVEITRAELIAGSNDTYRLGMYVHLNTGSGAGDDMTVSVVSYHENEDGTVSVTGGNKQRLSSETVYQLAVTAKYGDTIKVVVEGTQDLGRGVYFYEPEGGRDASQCLVGAAEGETAVRVEKRFAFGTDIEMGLRIYKTANGSGAPLSDITFDVYRVVPEGGEVLSDVPTAEEIVKYAVQENLVGSVTTDVTGYAALSLEKGYYLVVEQHNTQKVIEPVAPFYISVPIPVEQDGDNGQVTVEYQDIISVYPKNDTFSLPETDPSLPTPPDNVTGDFTLLKHDAYDESVALEGAVFQVYRPATAEDTDTKIITCNGTNYAVVAVLVDGAPLTLTTGADGTVTSPKLTCGVYFLVETKAPAGYNLPADAISVTVTSDELDKQETVPVPNQPGNLLPETGGMGTTWMMIVGSVVTVAAAVLLVTKRRMSAYE